MSNKICPVCDGKGWYYDPFSKKWKCSKCNYENESYFGKKFCYYCGEVIHGIDYSFVNQDGEWLFWHNCCFNKALEKVIYDE